MMNFTFLATFLSASHFVGDQYVGGGCALTDVSYPPPQAGPSSHVSGTGSNSQ